MDNTLGEFMKYLLIMMMLSFFAHAEDVTPENAQSIMMSLKDKPIKTQEDVDKMKEAIKILAGKFAIIPH